MIVLGIDPGYERMGYGVVQRQGSRLTAEKFGLIETPRIDLPTRLKLLHDGLLELITEWRPDALATEKLLFSVNRKTAIDVAKALGVVLLCGSLQGLEVYEYSPPEIKLSVVGVGNAEKKQVQYMVTKLLALEKVPRPDDVADALAIACCHALRGSSAPKLATR